MATPVTLGGLSRHHGASNRTSGCCGRGTRAVIKSKHPCGYLFSHPRNEISLVERPSACHGGALSLPPYIIIIIVIIIISAYFTRTTISEAAIISLPRPLPPPPSFPYVSAVVETTLSPSIDRKRSFHSEAALVYGEIASLLLFKLSLLSCSSRRFIVHC